MARRAGLDLSAAAEQQQMGLEFKQVAEVQPVRPRLPRGVGFALQGVVLFLLLVPCVGLGVAAFDPMLHGEADVRRIGLDYLGSVTGRP